MTKTIKIRMRAFRLHILKGKMEKDESYVLKKCLPDKTYIFEKKKPVKV